MGKLNINNGGIDTNKVMPDIDERFGPYASIEAANTALGASGRNCITAGLTVGITQGDGSVKEYWYQPQGAVLTLVPKQRLSGTPVEGDFASFDANGNIVDSGHKHSDYATASQGEKADTAYQKPSEGIPATDLASAAQTSLGKADTAVQEVKVGTTTTGAAGTNASVRNSGTDTHPVLDFTIPKGADGQAGADAVNPFKGWWPDLATLKAAITATPGDSAYVKDASPATTWSIYIYDSTASSDNYWSDSGTDADTSNVQTFESGQEVNETNIDDTHLANPKEGALPTANDTLQLKSKLDGITSNEIKVSYNEIENSCVLGMDGSIETSSGSSYIEIQLNNADKVRFLGYKRNTLSGNNSAGYAFGHYDNNVWVSDYFAFFPTDTSLPGSQPYEIIRDCPIGSTHFRTTSSFNGSHTLDGFYIYLIYGSNVKDTNLNTKIKLSDISAEKVTYKGYYQRYKYIKGLDGKFYKDSKKESMVVQYEIGKDIDKVVFLGLINATLPSANSLGYAFGYYKNNDSSSESNWVTLQNSYYPTDTSLEKGIIEELVVENKYKGLATHFRCIFQTSGLSISEDNFYCYFIKGYSANSNIGDIGENIPYTLENGLVYSGNRSQNPGDFVQNANSIVTNFVDISQFDKLYTIVTTFSSATTGVTSGYAFYDDNKTAIGGDSFKCVGDSISYHKITIDVPSNAKYFRTSIRKEFSNIFYLCGHRKDSALMNYVNKIEKQYINYVPILENLSFAQNFTLIHFSDIHSDNIALQQIVDFKRNHANNIVDVLHTGDNVWYKYDHGMDFWNSVDGAEQILNCLGNHDTSLSGGATFGNKTSAECRATFIEPYKDSWGNVVIGNNNECYYYKDYQSYNIRLIVLDLYHPDDYPSVTDTLGAAQQTWFEQALEDARTNELHVIVAGHATERYWGNRIDTPFDDLQRANNITMDDRLPSLGTATINAISSFIENGGHFVCYLCGHMHSDSFRKFNEHNNMLYVVVQNASVREHIVGSDSSTGPNNKSARMIGEQSENAFNLISVNTSNTILTITRIGQNYDVFGRHLGSVCYDYTANRIISQW